MNNRLERILQGMGKQEITPPQGLDDVISAIFPELKEKLNEKGSVKITIEGWSGNGGELENLEDISEFILIARSGKDMFFKSAASIPFRIAAISEIKDTILENL